MRWLLLCFYLIISTPALAGPAFGIFQVSGNSSIPSQSWNDLYIGGAGYVAGIAIAPDGTKIARSDVNPGIWWWNSTQWFPINNPNSNSDYTQATVGGVLEFAIASSNTSSFAMAFNTGVYVTLNHGTSWTKLTNFPSISWAPNVVPQKWFDATMAFDPNNANILYVSTPSNGLYVCVNTSGWASAACNVIPTGTIPTGGGFGHSIVFDTVNTGCTSPVGGVSQCIYASSYGNGWYRSTNGGTTWTSISSSGMPTTFYSASEDQDGVLWTTDNTYVGFGGVIHTYTPGGGWQADTSGSTLANVKVDPNDDQIVVACGNSGYCETSSNRAGVGTAATCPSASPCWNQFATAPSGPGAGPVNGGTDQAWGTTGNNNGTNMGGLAWDPTVPNKLYMSIGFGVLYTTNPLASTSQINWLTQVAGIENLDSLVVRANPNGTVWAGGQDIALWPLTPGGKATTYGPVYSGLLPTLHLGSSIDYSPNNNNIVCYVIELEGTAFDGCTKNNGGTYGQFSSTPGFSPNLGQILVVDDSDFIWTPQLQGPYWCNDATLACVSWTPGTDGASTYNGGICGQGSTTAVCRSLSMDSNGKVWMFQATANAGTDALGIWSSVDKGHTWSHTACSSCDPAPTRGGANMVLIAMTGITNDLYYTPGYHCCGTGLDTSVGLYKSTDGGGTWTQDTNFNAVVTMGRGAPCSGHSNGSLYVVGWRGGTTQSNYGTWESCDDDATWTQLGATTCSDINHCNVPMYNWAPIVYLDGDPNVIGRVFVAFIQGGFAFWQP